MAAPARSLDALKLDRQRLEEHAQRCLALSRKNLTDPAALSQFMARASRMTRSLAEFNSIVSQCYDLERTQNPNTQQQPYLEMVELFEDVYFEIMGIYDNHYKAPALTPNASATVMNTTIQQRSVKLPEIELQKFDGTIADWPEFRDNFEALIHSNEQLKSSAKLVYLRKSLTGPALALVKELPSTTLNYEIAWAALKTRYDNERMLGAELVNKILNFDPIKRESESELSRFLSTFGECFASLRQLSIIELDNFIVMHIALRALPVGLQKIFERTLDPKAIPSITDLVDFVQSQLRILGLVSASPQASSSQGGSSTTKRAMITASDAPSGTCATGRPSKGKFPGKHKGQMGGSHAHSKHGGKPSNSFCSPSGMNGNTDQSPGRRKTDMSCPQCNKPHRLMDCPEYVRMTTPQRRQLITKLQRCFNCLGPDHTAAECRSRYRCTHCQGKHHSTIHEDGEATTTNSPNNTSASAVHYTGTNQGDSPRAGTTIMLATALVRVKTTKGSLVVRALLDSAAQGTFLTTRCARRLKLHIEPLTKCVSGLAKNPVPIRNQVLVELTTISKQRIAKKHIVEILDEITAYMPSLPISSAVREKLTGWRLADPSFDKPGPIDLLIGADLYDVIFTGEKRSLGKDMPTAFSTLMGYVLLGRAPTVERSNAPIRTAMLTVQDQELHSAIQRFWQLEEPRARKIQEPEEDPAEIHFRTTTTRSPEGRFKVRLPFKEPPERLGESKPQALRRFKALEDKLRKNPQFKEEYVQLMKKYQKDGVMKLADPGVMNRPHFFLPHHGVLKASSTSSKLRIVYDASAKSSSGVSLNDILHVGPPIMCDIRDVLLRFRFHRYILVCDIRRMYLQLQLHEDDQPFHLLLWRDSESMPIQTYQLTTATFGVGSSAFQSGRSIKQLAIDHQDQYPLAASVLNEEIYVDNVTTGGPTIPLTMELMDQLVQVLGKGLFELRKFISNVPELLTKMPASHLETPVTWGDQQSSAFPIMGLHWIPKEDSFSYSIKITSKPPTKRGMLSAIPSVFDPCGWIAPVVFWAKSFIQVLWLSKYDWDSELPSKITGPWEDFLKELPELTKVKIPRFLEDPGKAIQVHAFGDASEKGYATVIYLRSEKPDGSVNISLITAKTKVAPLKRVTIPRLELCASALLATTLRPLLDELAKKCVIEQVFAWSDSTTVLQWLQTPSHRLKVFVANRVEYIQETLPNAQWKYVGTETNPADCASRGMNATELVDHFMWWGGPSWLSSAPEHWPSRDIEAPTTELPELRHVCVLTDSFDAVSSLFELHTSWTQLQRRLAYVCRFLHNRLHPKERRTGGLHAIDFEEADRLIIKRIQRTAFAEDIERLRNRKLTCTTRLQRLTPFLDKHGILRVGGRLTFANIPEEQKHPCILPTKHPLVESLIHEWHIRYLHAGAQQLHSIIFRKYWILSGRVAIRGVIHRCVPCYKANPHSPLPLMGDLPAPRVKPSRPFIATGVDYAGPFKVKVHTLRFAKVVNVYLCIYTCKSTKACHIEVTEDLTTPSFLAALTRMASRRGPPKDIYSDCGSNFVGASGELKRTVKELHKSAQGHSTLLRYTQEYGTNFHFNPPAAPHQGGLWEAAVKSTKKHLTRVIQGQTLTIEEFRTLCIRTEAMLNSRPLTPLSNDPSGLETLTPAHFLIGEPLTALPEPEYPQDQLPIKRWQRVQALAQALWRRWTNEYLQTLIPRGKWVRDQGRLKLGDLVLMHEHGFPTMKWKTGRVTAVHPGKDGRVRVATVRTAEGEYKRPVVKLFPLPIA